jgi:dynactin complex subunit
MTKAKMVVNQQLTTEETDKITENDVLTCDNSLLKSKINELQAENSALKKQIKELENRRFVIGRNFHQPTTPSNLIPRPVGMKPSGTK